MPKHLLCQLVIISQFLIYSLFRTTAEFDADFFTDYVLFLTTFGASVSFMEVIWFFPRVAGLKQLMTGVKVCFQSQDLKLSI